jgi:hypothetical protein
LQKKVKTSAWQGKHKQSFIGLDRRVPSSALTAALDKEQPKMLSLPFLKQREKEDKIMMHIGKVSSNEAGSKKYCHCV